MCTRARPSPSAYTLFAPHMGARGVPRPARWPRARSPEPSAQPRAQQKNIKLVVRRGAPTHILRLCRRAHILQQSFCKARNGLGVAHPQLSIMSLSAAHARPRPCSSLALWESPSLHQCTRTPDNPNIERWQPGPQARSPNKTVAASPRAARSRPSLFVPHDKPTQPQTQHTHTSLKTAMHGGHACRTCRGRAWARRRGACHTCRGRA